MSQVAYKEAEANLKALMDQAANGEEVIIQGEHGLEVQLVVIKPKRQVPKIGCAKGEIEILDGFDDPIEGFEEYM